MHSMNATDSKFIIKTGRQAISQEASALLKLEASLGDEFASAVQCLNDTTGRIIITGIGKSGHVGAKMAATFASTGSPSQFVHATEAAHGDLGMITSQDCIIAISKSGKTKELSRIVDYASLRNISLIAITDNPKSPLAEAANITLLLPAEEEACSMGLAPTTSTTMTMAMGDALAVALLQCKGFSPDAFRDFHPGGSLGNILTKASDIMHKGKDMPLVQEDVKMQDAIIAMAEKRFGCIGVTDKHGNFCGLITDGDLRRTMNDDFLSKFCKDIMTKNPYTVTADTPINAVLKTMNEKCFGVAFVIDAKKPVGIIHIHDILHTLAG